MKKKYVSKVVSSLLVMAMAASAVAGCGSSAADSAATTESKADTTQEAAASDSAAADTAADGELTGADKYPEFLTIDVFGGQSNYQGLQSGWFAKLVKDKFNMELNIIAPNVAGGGDTLFQTRSANGNLGDLILTNMNGDRLKDLVTAELVLDMTDYIDSTTYLSQYRDKIEKASALAEQEGLWAVPSGISQVSATEPGEISEPTNAPSLRWDIYKAVGYPEMETLEDLLDVLKQMQDAAGTSDSGQKVYALSLFSDWDGDLMQNGAAWSALYGYDPMGYLLFNITNGETQSVIDADSMYVRGLKFFFQANQMGLVDPESTTQNFDMVSAKFADGAILYAMWPWLGTGYYNSVDHLAEGKGFASAKIKDANYLCWGSSPDGSTSYGVMIGSQTKDPQRMVDFVDWMYSPEGIMAGGSDTNQMCGPEGLTWEIVDGEPQFTEFGYDALINKNAEAIVPEEWGGGTYSDGISALNYSAMCAKDVNPETGIPYNFSQWDVYAEINATPVSEDWNAHFNTTELPINYFTENGMTCTVPGIQWTDLTYSTELTAIKEQCKATIVDYSWRMCFAADEAEFDALLKEMQEIVVGLGYNDVIAFDQQRAEIRWAAYKEARGE